MLFGWGHKSLTLSWKMLYFIFLSNLDINDKNSNLKHSWQSFKHIFFWCLEQQVAKTVSLVQCLTTAEDKLWPWTWSEWPADPHSTRGREKGEAWLGLEPRQFCSSCVSSVSLLLEHTAQTTLTQQQEQTVHYPNMYIYAHRLTVKTKHTWILFLFVANHIPLAKH